MRASCKRIAALATVALLAACPQSSERSVSSAQSKLGPVPAQWKRAPVLTSRFGHAIAALGNKVIVFGGAVGGYELTDETWEFDGFHWTLKDPPVRPSARENAAMAALGDKIVLFGGDGTSGGTYGTLADTWEWDGATWTELHPATSPPAFLLNSSAPIMAAFGSNLYFLGSGFWRWDGNDWLALPGPPYFDSLHYSLVALPNALIAMGMNGCQAWDGTNWSFWGPSLGFTRAQYGLAALGSQLVAFGGCSPSDASCVPFDDTLVSDGSGWSAVAGGTHPSARSHSRMVALDGRIILFGGICQENTCTDTWAWDGANWSLVAPGTSPTYRAFPASTSWDGRLVLFGGALSSLDGTISTPLGDTWVFDDRAWTIAHPSISPGARSGAGMVALQGGALLFGGIASSGSAVNDTWSWDGAEWTQLFPSNSPSPRSQHAMAALGTHALLFGGQTAAGFAAETWEWDGSNWSQRSPSTVPPRPQRPPTMALVGEKVLLVVDSSVWAWSGDDWVQESGGATFPASSLGAVLATRGEKGVLCDPVRGPGQSPGTTTAWELDGLDWVSRSPLVTPIDIRVGAWASLPDGFVLFGKAGLYGPASFETIWTYSSGFAPGSACASHADCDSGYCVDGLCCDSLCPGQCEACDVADHRGTCSPVTGPPRGARESCPGVGACQGQCDGTNRTECVLPGASVFCAPAFCAFANATPEAHCDGQGACGVPTAVSCGDFACNGTRCHTTCLLSSDCAPGHTCVTGSCIVVAVDAGQSGPDAHSGTATEPHGCGCTEGNAGPLNAAALALLLLLRQLLFHSVTRRSARAVALRQ